MPVVLHGQCGSEHALVASDPGSGLVRLPNSAVTSLSCRLFEPVLVDCGADRLWLGSLCPYPSDVAHAAGSTCWYDTVVSIPRTGALKYMKDALLLQERPNVVVYDNINGAEKVPLAAVVDLVVDGSEADGTSQEEAHRYLLGKYLVSGCNVDMPTGGIRLTVEKVIPEGKVSAVDTETIVRLLVAPSNGARETRPTVGSVRAEVAKTVVGQDDVVRGLLDVLLLPQMCGTAICAATGGIMNQLPRGVLLSGPSGSGKTHVVRAVSKACGVEVIEVGSGDVVSSAVGESERNLRATFEAAHARVRGGRYVVIVFDAAHVIFPKRDPHTSTAASSRIVAQILTLLDGVEDRGNIIVVACTNKPNEIDPALRRPGRLEVELAMQVPNVEERELILQLYTNGLVLHEECDLADIAQECVGFLPADLAAVSRVAMLSSLSNSNRRGGKLIVTGGALRSAIRSVGSTLVRGSIGVRNTGEVIGARGWDDVGGLEDVKKNLRRAVEWPLLRQEVFERFNIKPPRGILLYGPPGCAKTSLIKALVRSIHVTFLTLDSASIYSPFVGDAEKEIRSTFDRARKSAPCVIFFDEVEALVGNRQAGDNGTDGGVAGRVLSTLLNEMDGVEATNGVLVVGATNRPDMIDSALLRPGRFDDVIFVPPPDRKAREQIFAVHTRNMPLDGEVSLSALAAACEGYTGAEIESVCREAALLALNDNIGAQDVGPVHFESALQKVVPARVVSIPLSRPN